MRLLVIEDYFPLRKSMLKGLRAAGYAVDVAADGENGLWYAMGNQYDVILLDLMLPRLDGLSLLRKLRAEGRTDHVLILTAKDAVADRVRGLEAGADDYLVKPFAFDELLGPYQRPDPAQIRPQRPDTPGRPFAAGHRLATGLAGRRRDPVDPARIQLAGIPGDAGRERPFPEPISGSISTTSSTSSSSNVVDVYVGYLRKKIDLPGKPSLIRTVRGRGYALGEKS